MWSSRSTPWPWPCPRAAGGVLGAAPQRRDLGPQGHEPGRGQHEQHRHGDEHLAAGLDAAGYQPDLGASQGEHERELADLGQRQPRRQRHAQGRAQKPGAERGERGLEDQDG